ncbi:hypothetical protein FACS1894159_08390 [Bacteroidia bacterium]|nr:hypothetical protein FACS1894159_08390 [Bacteroidia bacterium]
MDRYDKTHEKCNKPLERRALGLDLGTNSLGWAIVEQGEYSYSLIDRGVDIFQEGVKIERGRSYNEESRAGERTLYRSARRRLARRKLRKIETLKVLSEYGLCPTLSVEQLHDWRQHDKYPLDDKFLAWQRTAGNNNPYFYRNEAINRRFDLRVEADRYALGRALYHLAQRRGFLSNRLEKTKESEGKVKEGITQLDKDIQEAGCRFLGEYFFRCYQNGTKIRTRYTSRKEHYQAEFDHICDTQQLPEEWRKALEKAIFFQRKLRSQKGLVGRCTFEKNKSRCPASHPRFEEYRMLCFLNNIKIQTPRDEALRPLNAEEREKVMPLFVRKSKRQFNFEDIAKKLAGKDDYAFYRDRDEKPYRFNYRKDTSVAGSPVTAHLIDIFGDDWQQAVAERYTAKETQAGPKSVERIVDDIWHALFSMDNDDRLGEFAQRRLQCTEEEAKKFCAIPIQQEYASLSLCAIDRMLPFLREGMLYSHAVFLAGIGKALPAVVWNDAASRHNIISEVVRIVENFTQDDKRAGQTIEDQIVGFLKREFNVEEEYIKKKIYHPSMIDLYPEVKPDDQGRVRLGSPRTSSVRNPMAMRALFRLRRLVNTLLDEGKIDGHTKIRIEFARGLNDANRRKAIEADQREREKARIGNAQRIRELYLEQTGQQIEPTETDLLKFQLWEEQDHKCPYTGREIALNQFIGPNPKFDIEHTVPRSKGGDNSQMNKTLCQSRFNREDKKDKLPSELANHNDILARIEKWHDRAEELRSQIQDTKRKFASTKEDKDKNIQKRHELQIKHDYWRGKYERFTMETVPDGFANRQGVDIGIISRYARLYLKSVFDRTYVVKGITTSEFRKMWGLQEGYQKKERVNHVHHCVDAITIACIGPNEMSRMSEYFHHEEEYRWYGNRDKPQFPKPWPTFTEDVLAVEQELLVSHHTPEVMSRQTRKKLRVRGKVQYRRTPEGELLHDANGRPMPVYVQGDSARGSLHQDTFYGAIMHEGELKHVVRKSLRDLKETDIAKIVDPAVRERVQQAIDERGFKQAMANKIWMNEEKGVEIKKVRYFVLVSAPILLKEHRDHSRHDHKRHLRVVNDGNYLMAIYEGPDAKGRTKRSFEIVNNLEAATHFKASGDREAFPDIIPDVSSEGYPLKWTFKQGTMVLLYENSPAELYDATAAELRKRLYKVIGMSETVISGKYHYGSFTLKHHQEARPSGDLKAKNGDYKCGEEYRPIIGMYHTQIKALVEGYDFFLTVTGEVKFKNDQ